MLSLDRVRESHKMLRSYVSDKEAPELHRYKILYETFDCKKADLHARFQAHRQAIRQRAFEEGVKAMNGTLVGAPSVEIAQAPPFADREVAEKAIAAAARKGGDAIAVQLAEPDPVTGSRIDPQTGQRRLVWLVGALVDTEKSF